jgi:hypothetical protein
MLFLFLGVMWKCREYTVQHFNLIVVMHSFVLVKPRSGAALNDCGSQTLHLLGHDNSPVLGLNMTG